MKRFNDMTAVELADKLLQQAKTIGPRAHIEMARILKEVAVMQLDFTAGLHFRSIERKHLDILHALEDAGMSQNSMYALQDIIARKSYVRSVSGHLITGEQLKSALNALLKPSSTVHTTTPNTAQEKRNDTTHRECKSR